VSHLLQKLPFFVGTTTGNRSQIAQAKLSTGLRCLKIFSRNRQSVVLLQLRQTAAALADLCTGINRCEASFLGALRYVSKREQNASTSATRMTASFETAGCLRPFEKLVI